MRSDIVPGAAFPDYNLADHTVKHRTLSELQEGDPLVLVLARGGYCPKERRQHEGLLQLHREMQVGYCRLVTISTDTLLETAEFRGGVGGHWTFPSDPGRKVQKDLDIVEYTDPDHNPMIPHEQVGGELGISEITVKAHLGQVMSKMKADSLPALVTMATRLGLRRSAEAVPGFWSARQGRSMHVNDPYAPDDHRDARTVHRRAHRLRAGAFEALWQQRGRVPQGASPWPL